MKASKFQKWDRAFIISLGYDGHHLLDVICESLKVIQIRITGVKGQTVTGETTERYGYIKKYRPGDLKNIITKRRKRSGKEIEFKDDEFVRVSREYKSDILLTEGEMKLKMIDYIIHDFSTEDERDFHEDESW